MTTRRACGQAKRKRLAASSVGPMSEASGARSENREVSVLFRMSRADREELRRKAAERGLSVQVYMHSVLLETDPAPLKSGRPKGRRTRHPQVAHQEELQMQGHDQEAELSMTG